MAERREGVRPLERAKRASGLRLDDALEQAHGQRRLIRLAEDGEHHPAGDARRCAPRPGRHVHETEVVPDLALRDPERLREGLAFVAAAEAQRRVSVSQEADRLVPLVPHDVERHEPLLDEAPEEAQRLCRRGRTERDALGPSTCAPLEARKAIRKYAVASPASDPPGMTIGLRTPALRERTPDRPEVGPRRRGREAEPLELVAAIPEPARRPRRARRRRSCLRTGSTRTRGARKSTSCSSRTHLSFSSSSA